MKRVYSIRVSDPEELADYEPIVEYSDAYTVEEFAATEADTRKDGCRIEAWAGKFDGREADTVVVAGKYKPGDKIIVTITGTVESVTDDLITVDGHDFARNTRGVWFSWSNR